RSRRRSRTASPAATPRGSGIEGARAPTSCAPWLPGRWAGDDSLERMNQTLRLFVLLGVGFGLAVCAMVAMPERIRRRLVVTNHRGRKVPATLGVAAFVASVGAQLVAGLAAMVAGTGFGSDTWAILAGAALVFAAGL